MRSEEGSNACHQRDILLPNDTNQQHRELRNTGTNRSIVQPNVGVRKKINEGGNIITAHYTTQSLL